MRLRRLLPALVAATGFSLAGCDVDTLLETEVPPDIHLAISTTTSTLSLAPGGTATMQSSITRLGEYTGAVEFEFANVPDGITAEVSALATSGLVTSATITFRALPAAGVGTFSVTIAGKAGGTRRTAQQVALLVVETPGVGVFPSKASILVIRGGIAPLNVALSRTNFTGAVTFALTGAPAGVTLDLATNPITTNLVSGTLSIASTVAPGTYSAKVRASAIGIADAESPVSIIVSPDAMQLLVDDAATAQATVVTASVTVNRFNVTAPVTLSALGLPTGMTVSFPEGTTMGTTATARFSVGASTQPGAYSVTLRGQAPGVADAVTAFNIAVAPSNVAMTLVPQNVTMLQGTTAASSLQLVRTSFLGAVRVDVLASPAGISVAPADPTVTGSSTTLVVQAAQNVAPGTYMLSIRVVPLPSTVDGPSLDPITTSFGVTVVESPIVNSNVLLDWSACGAPSWVAAQNGTGPWTRLTGSQGRFGFALTSVRGGFAYDDGAGVTVRYMTSAELTAGPINLCAPVAPATRSINGTASHAGSADAATWRLGGGVGTSTSAVPFFTMTGVTDGTHDLIGWGTSQSQTRMLIMRDVNEPAGGTVGTVGLVGPFGFTPNASQFSLQGFQGERMTLAFSYLTTAACTANPVWETGQSSVSGTLTTTVFGVPAVQQRPTDFHLVALMAIGTNVIRTSSISFNRTIPTRQLALPTLTPVVISTVSGTHMRLRATISAMPADYNRSMTLRFSSEARSATVIATAGTLASGIVVLDFPDLGGVPGFPSASVPPPGAHGNFSTTLEGSTGEATLCAENATRASQVRSGPY